MIKKFDMTDEQVKSVVDSKPYQKWKAYAESSADWRYWCYKTLYPDEGAVVPQKYIMYVYVYIERDTEDNVRPMARTIEFTLWLIETQYSGRDSATARLLKGYAKEHLALIEDISNEHFKDSKVYAPVRRFVRNYRASLVGAGASGEEGERRSVERKLEALGADLENDYSFLQGTQFKAFIVKLVLGGYAVMTDKGCKVDDKKISNVCLAAMLGVLFWGDKITKKFDKWEYTYKSGAFHSGLWKFFCFTRDRLNDARNRLRNNKGGCVRDWCDNFSELLE